MLSRSPDHALPRAAAFTAERVSAQKHLGGLLTRALTNWMEGSQTKLGPSGTEFKSRKDAIHTSVPQHSSINSQDIGRNVTAKDFLNADVPMAARMVKLSPLSEECASCPATQTNLGSICGSQTSKPIAQRLPLVQDQNRYISSLRSSTENGLNNLMILRSGASDHCRWSNLKAQSSTVGALVVFRFSNEAEGRGILPSVTIASDCRILSPRRRNRGAILLVRGEAAKDAAPPRDL